MTTFFAVADANGLISHELKATNLGDAIRELCVDALTRDDDELRAIASDLLVLVRYHEQKAKS
ncbi:MAG: hypothetical protein ABFD89_17450 [Bryobacteraceae bacterium]